MRRPWHIWSAFLLALAISLAGMGWVSLTALRLDRTEHRARLQAAREAKVKLALWRMDSALAPLIAQENYRPYFTYHAFYPAERAYTRLFQPVDPGEVLVPSPLLGQVSPYIRLHFQFAPDGTLTSPQVPSGNMRDLAEVAYTTHEDVVAAAALLDRLDNIVARGRLLTAIPAPPVGADGELPRQGQLPDEPAPATVLPSADGAPAQEEAPTEGEEDGPDAADPDPVESPEWHARRQATMMANSLLNPGQGEQARPKAPSRAEKVTTGLMRPVWVGDELFLARRVSMEEGDHVQGCWLDWPAVQAWLLKDARGLLPVARLEPVRSEAAIEPARMMAGLPVRLVPGALAEPPSQGLSAVQLTLLVAWCFVAVAGVAVGSVVHAAVSLSERRGAFVSAVTHEMRTPLTTFQMYTEMLAEGMIQDEEKRLRYLRTLRVEAERLAHLVENVLAYARLERGKRVSGMDVVTLGGLVEDLRDRFEERARHAGMRFVVEAGDDESFVRADTSAVERILFNLIDNACKYARNAEDRRIHLVLDRVGNFARLRVWDHGPGVSEEQAPLLFTPFSKSAHDAAHSAPGVGLGLALSRRLARRMGGDLVLDRSVKSGACFVLSLPVSGQ